MHCNFCFGAGRDNFYTHNTKDKNGNVTCKLLLMTQCPCCNKYGHTRKNCPDKDTACLKVSFKPKPSFKVTTPTTYDKDGFITVNSNTISKIKKNEKSQAKDSIVKTNKSSNNMFSMLDHEESSDSETEILDNSGIKEKELLYEKSNTIDKVTKYDNKNITKIIMENGTVVIIDWKNYDTRKWADIVEDDSDDIY